MAVETDVAVARFAARKRLLRTRVENAAELRRSGFGSLAVRFSVRTCGVGWRILGGSTIRGPGVRQSRLGRGSFGRRSGFGGEGRYTGFGRSRFQGTFGRSCVGQNLALSEGGTRFRSDAERSTGAGGEKGREEGPELFQGLFKPFHERTELSRRFIDRTAVPAVPYWTETGFFSRIPCGGSSIGLLDGGRRRSLPDVPELRSGTEVLPIFLCRTMGGSADPKFRAEHARTVQRGSCSIVVTMFQFFFAGR